MIIDRSREMCGRYGLTMDQQDLLANYGAELFMDHVPRFNIAPSQEVPVLVQDERGRRIEGFRWGLIPSWAKDPKIGYRMINARSETAARKPAFRDAWRARRRCLVLADGFYEWQQSPSGKGPKVPHWIRMADGRPFGFAGLWEEWGPQDGVIRTCTILTTEPNDLVKRIHDRMPVVLAEEAQWTAWVDPAVPSEEVEELLVAPPSEEMHAQPVSTFVNKPANEGPGCIAPVAEDGPEPVDPEQDGPEQDGPEQDGPEQDGTEKPSFL
jgi:putative SOS response-associated peptidase YedK